MGVSLLVSRDTNQLKVLVHWGDYVLQESEEGAEQEFREWKRRDRAEAVIVSLPDTTPQLGKEMVPNGRGLEIAWSVRSVPDTGFEGGLPAGTRSVSVFLVNRRAPAPDDVRDEAFAFQARLEIHSEEPLVARPNLHSLGSDDWGERVADLQYRDAYEFAVGHGVSTDAVVKDGQCLTVHTRWIPQAEVERVASSDVGNVELSMDILAALTDGADAQAKLSSFAVQYRDWIKQQ